MTRRKQKPTLSSTKLKPTWRFHSNKAIPQSIEAKRHAFKAKLLIVSRAFSRHQLLAIELVLVLGCLLPPLFIVVIAILETFFLVHTAGDLLFTLLVPGLAVVAASLVPVLVNPIHALLSLLALFANAIVIYLSLGAEYLALVFFIVYIGALAILFLFVIMLLNVRELMQKHGTAEYCRALYNVLAAAAALLFLRLTTNLSVGFDKLMLLSTDPLHLYPSTFEALKAYITTDIVALQALYTKHAALFLMITAILFESMLGAIIVAAMTSNTRKGERKAAVLSPKKEDKRLEAVKSGFIAWVTSILHTPNVVNVGNEPQLVFYVELKNWAWLNLQRAIQWKVETDAYMDALYGGFSIALTIVFLLTLIATLWTCLNIHRAEKKLTFKAVVENTAHFWWPFLCYYVTYCGLFFDTPMSAVKVLLLNTVIFAVVAWAYFQLLVGWLCFKSGEEVEGCCELPAIRPDTAAFTPRPLSRFNRITSRPVVTVILFAILLQIWAFSVFIFFYTGGVYIPVLPTITADDELCAAYAFWKECPSVTITRFTVPPARYLIAYSLNTLLLLGNYYAGFPDALWGQLLYLRSVERVIKNALDFRPGTRLVDFTEHLLSDELWAIVAPCLGAARASELGTHPNPGLFTELIALIGFAITIPYLKTCLQAVAFVAICHFSLFGFNNPYTESSTRDQAAPHTPEATDTDSTASNASDQPATGSPNTESTTPNPPAQSTTGASNIESTTSNPPVQVKPESSNTDSTTSNPPAQPTPKPTLIKNGPIIHSSAPAGRKQLGCLRPTRR